MQKDVCETAVTKALLVLHTQELREKAARWCMGLPQDSRVTFEGPKRTLPQNSRFWAMLTDLSSQLKWHGLMLTPDDWKLIFLDALKREVRIVPNIDGTGFVNIGSSSSNLSVQEMADCITLIEAFGANHGVVFHNPDDPEAPKRARKRKVRAWPTSPTAA
jgi:hypothetical protein